MPTPEEILQAQVRAASVPIYMTGKSELVEYYQETYGKGWKQRIVHDLADITGMKPKNLERRFDPSRLNLKSSPKAQAQYKALGQTKPPTGMKPPPGGYKVWFVMDIWISKGWYRRSKTIRITGPDAYTFSQTPTDAQITAAYFAESGQDDLAEDWSNQRYAVTAA